MKESLRTSQEGITLIELLVVLVITSIIVPGIVNYLLNGMNSYKKVNEEISLHDAANDVMSHFERYIVVATDARNINPCEGGSLIEVDLKNFDDTDEVEKVKLGFKNNQAVINDEPIHSSKFKLTEDSEIFVEDEVEGKRERNIRIKMIIVDTKSNQKVELTNIVSFRKIEK